MIFPPENGFLWERSAELRAQAEAGSGDGEQLEQVLAAEQQQLSPMQVFHLVSEEHMPRRSGGYRGRQGRRGRRRQREQAATAAAAAAAAAQQ